MTFKEEIIRRAKKIAVKQITRGEITIKNPQDKWKYSLAFFISRVFGPFPLVCVLWLTTALKSGIGFWKAILVYPLIFFVDIAIPIAITSYLIYAKKVKDIEWSDLEQRNQYLLPISFIAIPLLLFLTYFLTNSTIFHLSILFSIIVLSMLTIYRFFHFKISGHIVTATIVISGVNLFFGLNFLWLFLLIIPIIWARYTLKVHTLVELISGFVLPAIIMLMAVFIFGWPNIKN